MATSTPEETQALVTSTTLLSRLRDMRNHASWQRFHEIYRPLLLAVALRSNLREQDAQDVVQETIVEVAVAMPSFRYDRAKGRFKGWLLTIVRRRIANAWRSKHYQHGGERIPREQLADPSTLDAGEEQNSDFTAIWDEEWREHALRVAEEHVKHEVQPVQFQAFKMHVVKGVSAGEVARRLGVKLMEVYWAKYRVGRLMKKAVAEAENF